MKRHTPGRGQTAEQKGEIVWIRESGFNVRALLVNFLAEKSLSCRDRIVAQGCNVDRHTIFPLSARPHNVLTTKAQRHKVRICGLVSGWFKPYLVP